MCQKDLARDVGTRGYISQIEKGNAMPSFESISKLTERLNCFIRLCPQVSPHLFFRITPSSVFLFTHISIKALSGFPKYELYTFRKYNKISHL
ncbi:helix-turn-helix domain-containing protein [Paenibacillus sp. A3M_27_13]|uniref:helix-turn-helix domain-containing protein n=1 Tax=Paenibacillus sp. A3M_27_13 TaxID=2962029 RepID=UPI00349F107E